MRGRPRRWRSEETRKDTKGHWRPEALASQDTLNTEIHLLHKTREQLKRWWFSARCGDILSTQPLEIKKSNIRIISMVSHSDLVMYLVAVKSLYSYLAEGEVIIVNDGTLTARDIRLLKAHVSPSLIVRIDDISTGRCPTSGCWQRLLFISDHVKDHYVIQLDSDTVTLKPVPEVIRAAKENRSFTLGTSMGRTIAPMDEVCRQMQAFRSDHVQVVAEQSFHKLRDFSELKYVRGSAAFAGFARGSIDRCRSEEFSEMMGRIVGKIWFDWGSEQVTSNFIVANSPEAVVLPYPRYANYWPEIPYNQSSFLHFIGTYRFRDGIYVKKAKDVVKQLSLMDPCTLSSVGAAQ